MAKRILDEEPRAVCTQCYGHSINLAASDAVKQTKLMRDALDMTHEITKLIKYFPRREAVFRDLKEENEMSTGCHSPGIRVLCPTRWTVRADSLASILDNYNLLQSTREEAVEIARDTETKARINGVAAQMKTFNFLFGTILGEMLLRHTDNLSQTLQKKTISAAEGQQVGRMVIDTLCTLRTKESYGKKQLQLQSLSMLENQRYHANVRFQSVMIIVLVMPATNATSEHSFSALRRVKSYLRSTMTQQRLNNLMVLHVHKERTDALNEVDIANELVGVSEHRLRMFGKFQ